MKKKQRLFLLLGSLCALIVIRYVHTTCNQTDKQHEDKNVVRCFYSQKDLRKMSKKNSHRNTHNCPFCGCQTSRHTEQ